MLCISLKFVIMITILMEMIFLCMWFQKLQQLLITNFWCCIEPETNLLHSRYLQLNELVLEDVIWVDEVNGLRKATCHIEECKMVGIDCEWKPNYEKGSKPNKVILGWSFASFPIHETLWISILHPHQMDKKKKVKYLTMRT